MCGMGSHQFQAVAVAAAADGVAGGGVGAAGVGAGAGAAVVVAVVAVAVAVAVAAAHAACVIAEFGVVFEDSEAEDSEAAILGQRESARTGKVVMVDLLAMVVLWLDVDEMVHVAAAVEGSACWNTKEPQNVPERVVD